MIKINNKKNNKGFTLIELLLVISIIGLLSSIVLASLGTARAKGRDSQRISGLKQVQIALEMYYDDNGSYPDNESTSGNANADCWECTTITYQDSTKLNVAISSYLKTRPADPSSPLSGIYDGFWYKTSGSGQDYVIAIMNTSENFNSIPASLQNTIFSSFFEYNSIFISTPNAKGWTFWQDTSAL